MREYGTKKKDIYTMNDICNPFYDSTNSDDYLTNFGVRKREKKLKYCSPGCIDHYYDKLQYFNGQTSRPRERLFFSNYTHLANKLYPLPINLRTFYRPMMGSRAVAGDARKQATNFTDCPDFWNVFKIEAAVYPIDDNFNMCGDEAFYTQSKEESIDCAFTERVGYFFIGIGACSIVIIYIVRYFIVFIKRNDYFERELPPDQFETYEAKTSGTCCDRFVGTIGNSLKLIGLTILPLPLPILTHTQTILKNSILFLLTPLTEALDVVLDGIYIVRMSRVSNRFWIEAKIIRLMLKLYMVSVVKDIILSLILTRMFFKKSLELTPQQNFKLNFISKVFGFFLENTAQSVLQYFYLEKYQMDGDVVIIFKFIIGILVTGKALLTLLLAVIRVKKENMKPKDWFTALVYIMLTIVPLFRLIGLMIQAAQTGSMIRAGCLEYQISFTNHPTIRSIDPYSIDYHHNYQWDTFYLMGRDHNKFYNENNATLKRLYLNPFNSQCLTAIDYMYLIGE